MKHNESHPISYETDCSINMDYNRNMMWLTLETGDRKFFPVLGGNHTQLVTPKRTPSQKVTNSSKSLSEVRSASLFLIELSLVYCASIIMSRPDEESGAPKSGQLNNNKNSIFIIFPPSFLGSRCKPLSIYTCPLPTLSFIAIVKSQ